MSDSNPITILRRPAVEARTGLARSTIYEMVQKGLFPRPILLSARSVGWMQHEIDSWIKMRLEKSRPATLVRGGDHA